jgi:hypothetical protein
VPCEQLKFVSEKMAPVFKVKKLHYLVMPRSGLVQFSLKNFELMTGPSVRFSVFHEPWTGLPQNQFNGFGLGPHT